MPGTNVNLSMYRNPSTGRLDPNYGAENDFLNGQPFTINGSGFGLKSGYSDHINTSGILDLSDGSNFGSVGRWDGSIYQGSKRFSIESEGINGKCLKATRVFGDGLNIVFTFNYDAPVQLGKKIFSSRWVKHTSNAVVGGQWKYDRYQKNPASVSDKASELYWNANNSSPDNKIQVRDYRGVSSAGDFTKYGSSNVTYMPHQKNTWFRMDMLITLPSSYATPDEFQCESWIYYSPTLAPIYTLLTNNQAVDHVSPYGQAGDEWVQHLFQNYLGNGDFGTADHVMWYDKVFESVGDDKRVEYCNTADYASRTRTFTQPIGSWSDSAIYMPKVDKGDITSGYLHVISNGVSIYSEQR